MPNSLLIRVIPIIHEAIIVLNIDFMLVGGQKSFLGSIGLDVDVNSFFEKPNLQATSKL
jgi:hypothetical protein